MNDFIRKYLRLERKNQAEVVKFFKRLKDFNWDGVNKYNIKVFLDSWERELSNLLEGKHES